MGTTGRRPLSETFVRLLFTTGVRIGAAARIRWHQVRRSDHRRSPHRGERRHAGAVTDAMAVREKGNAVRIVLLSPATRAAFAALWLTASPSVSVDARVFPRSVRQLRNERTVRAAHRPNACSTARVATPASGGRTAIRTVGYGRHRRGAPLREPTHATHWRTGCSRAGTPCH